MDNAKLAPQEKQSEINESRMSRMQLSLMPGTLVSLGITASVVLVSVVFLLAFLWYAVNVLLLIFAGILLAILLRTLSDWVSKYARLSGGWSLAVVVLALVAILSIGGWLLAPRVASQVDQLLQRLPQSAQQLRQRVEQYQWGQQLLAQMPNAGKAISNRANILGQATDVFSMALNALVYFVFILFIGLFLAAQPGLYINGLVRLVPGSKRDRACEVLSALRHTLGWWLIGRTIAMIAVGLVTALGLWLLGVPLALTLGLLAGLLNFIPNVGPILAGVPAVFLAFMQGPMLVFYVVLLYLVIQTVEGYVLTPLVQRRTVSLPPALTITAQILLGVLVGFLGVAFATPLAAATLTLVKMLYIEDTLGEPAAVQGEHSG